MKKLWAALAAAFLIVPAYGAQTIVQKCGTHAHTATSMTLNVVTLCGANTTAGNLLVTSQSGGTTQAPHNTPTDTQTNTWASAINSSNATVGAEIKMWYVKNCPGGALTVTYTANTNDDIHAQFYELSGSDTAAPLDKTGTGADTTSATSHSVTTSAAVSSNVTLIAGFYSFNFNNTFTKDTNYVDGVTTNEATGGDSSYGETRIMTGASGTQTASVTFGTADTTVSVIASFLASGGGPTCAQSIALMGVGCR